MSDIKTVPARILIEKFPNDRIRDFCTTMQLTEAKGARLGRGGLSGLSLGDEREKAGETAEKLLQRIYELHGVEEVKIEMYEVRVTIGKAFDWNDVQPSVLAVLKTVYGDAEVEVVQKYASGYFKHGTEPAGRDDEEHPEPAQPEQDEDNI